MEPNVPYVVPLGAGAALTGDSRANSYLAVVRRGGYWLVDCADNPIARLQRAGLDPLTVRGIILTHFHPDHVYGLPSFWVGMLLLNRMRPGVLTAPLRIYARPEVLTKVERLAALFELETWDGMFPFDYHAIEPEVGARVAEDDDFTITAAPTRHLIPSLALRFLPKGGGRALVYSSDTEPCPEVEQLAQGAGLLFHEATDYPKGHTRPEDAGALASRAGVKRLVLIHYNSDPNGLDYLLMRARTTFSGPVELAEEFRPYVWL